MLIEQPSFSVSKGELPIELGESAARFIGKVLREITELNWAGHWAFWEWFWAVLLGLGFILGVIALLRKTNA
ncbi:hypothetical protein [Dechloromonas sp. ZS-1]|uniref:hypothetical protein n=1 Tax=Dechloromonas sp. ZS-1 TaxID=3138067 RepID=UPI0031FD1215